MEIFLGSSITGKVFMSTMSENEFESFGFCHCINLQTTSLLVKLIWFSSHFIMSNRVISLCSDA